MKLNLEQQIEILSKKRERMFVPLLVAMLITISGGFIETFTKQNSMILALTVLMFSMLVLIGAIRVFIMSMKIESEIKVLKLADSLQQKQNDETNES